MIDTVIARRGHRSRRSTSSSPGRRVVFEPHAIVWAEEPRDIGGLWKQRLRWARGNVQVTLRYRRRVAAPRDGGRLGGISFALIWFSLLLMPVFMISSSIGADRRCSLLDRDLSIDAFRLAVGVNLVDLPVHHAVELLASTGRRRARSWREAILFPGLISLAIIVYALVRRSSATLARRRRGCCSPTSGCRRRCSRRASSSASRRRRVRRLRWRGRCSTSSATGRCCARSPRPRTSRRSGGAEMRWEKTEKTGKVGELA